MRLCSRSYKHPEHWGCECGVQFSEPAFSLMARPLQVLCCLISSNHFFLNACIFYPNLRVDLIGRVFHTLCHGVNEKCRCQAKDAAVIKPSSHSSSRRRDLRALGMETNRLPACWQALSHCCSPTSVHPEGTRDERTQDTGPRELRCRSKDGFSKPRLLHLSLGRKALNSLTWDIQFSLINSNLLM